MRENASPWGWAMNGCESGAGCAVGLTPARRSTEERDRALEHLVPPRADADHGGMHLHRGGNADPHPLRPVGVGVALGTDPGAPAPGEPDQQRLPGGTAGGLAHDLASTSGRRWPGPPRRRRCEGW